MKTASLPNSPVPKASPHHGLVARLLDAPRALKAALGDQAATLPAIGLAEGGDVEGAAELLARTTRKSS